MKKFNPQRRVWRNGRIWDESKYVPHQGEAEKARRRGETGWWAKRMEAALTAFRKLEEGE